MQTTLRPITTHMEAAAHLRLAGSSLRPHLGALLVRDGLVSAEQLEWALAVKESRPDRRLGEILVEGGVLSASALGCALAEQHGLPFIELGEQEIEPTAATLLPEKFARRYHALPLRFVRDDCVLVAVADPTDVVSSDELRLALGLNVELTVADGHALEQAITGVHRERMDLDVEAEEDIEDDVDPNAEVTASATSAPAIKLVNSLIARAIEDGASDIHFEPHERHLLVRARIDGVTRRLMVIPKADQPAVIGRLKVMAGLDIAQKRAAQDGRAAIRANGIPVDMRVAALPTRHGEQVVLRILHRGSVRRGLNDLGMRADAELAFNRAINQPYGAVITCGPTGSGKTTTLYAALDILNDDERVLMTIEDPVEYQIPGVMQIEVSPRSGLTFASGLRTILRSDPDVLLVGEIRDEETARIAIQAAMTGHLVLTTLHTHNAASSIARLKNMGVDPSLLATALNCIVAQRLARRLCEHCKEAYEATPAERTEMGLGPDDGDGVIHRAAGCPACTGTGYRGRVALYEVMMIQGKVRQKIEASTEETFAAAVEQGMTTLRQDGIRLVLDGTSSLDEIRRVTGDRLV
jgi:type IV pilus assembly protein PilB